MRYFNLWPASFIIFQKRSSCALVSNRTEEPLVSGELYEISTLGVKLKPHG